MKWLNLFKRQNLYKLIESAELEQAEQEIKILHHDLKVALKNLINSKSNTSKHIPIFLLLGAQRAGKTSLLVGSGLDLKDPYGSTLTQAITTNYCAWWSAKNTIFLDTDGAYTESKDHKSANSLAWRSFLKLLKRYFGTKHTIGLILILDLPILAENKAHLDETLANIRHRIYEITKYIDDIPIYVVFTKSDLIAGFTDFFATLDATDRKKILGINFPEKLPLSHTPQVFAKEFTQLLQRLHRQTFQHLHQQYDEDTLGSINDFPLQLDYLKDTIIGIINKIPTHPSLHLMGIYFTSSIQKGETKDYLAPTMLSTLALKCSSRKKIAAQSSHSYFTTDLFNKISASKPKIHKPSLLKKILSKYTPIIIATIVIAGSSGFLYSSYAANLIALQNIKAIFNTVPFTNLIQLNSAITTLENTQAKWWARYFNQPQNIRHTIKAIYRNYAATNLVTKLQTNLEAELDTDTINPRKLYDSLKAYLLITNHKQLNHDHLEIWLKDHLAETIPNDATQYSNDLDLLLRSKLKVTQHPSIVTKARNTLANVKPQQLVYLLLENSYDNQVLSLHSKNIDQKQITVSRLYTADNFDKVVTKQIPELIKTSQQNDWILGTITIPTLSQPETTKLTTKIQDLYYKSYVDSWAQALDSVYIQELQTIKQVSQLLTAMQETNAKVLIDLKTAQTNTALRTAPLQFKNYLNTKLPALNSFSADKLAHDLDKINSLLKKLDNNTDSRSHKSFILATKHLHSEAPTEDPVTLLQKLAAKQPQPLKNWLQLIAQHSWKVILGETQVYINTMWTNTVAPFCQKNINKHYPLDKNSTTDLSIEVFSNYFGPNGVFDNFANKYIKPFANTEQMYWTWKTIDNQTLNIPQTSLEMLIHTNVIQKMFFPTDNLQPSSRFILIPKAITPSTKNFKLELDGQLVGYDPENGNQHYYLMWPGPQPNHAMIEFTDQNGKTFTLQETGPWAWLRLLNKANIKQIDGSQHYELTFSLDNNTVQYELITAQAVNPFVTDLLDGFYCNDSL